MLFSTKYLQNTEKKKEEKVRVNWYCYLYASILKLTEELYSPLETFDLHLQTQQQATSRTKRMIRTPPTALPTITASSASLWGSREGEI